MTSTWPLSGRSCEESRSEEHTSELQSLRHLVCRLLLEKKNANIQPGVTKNQLYQLLKTNNIPLQLDVTAAGLDASTTGTILDRSFGHPDYADRISQHIT